MLPSRGWTIVQELIFKEMLLRCNITLYLKLFLIHNALKGVFHALSYFYTLYHQVTYEVTHSIYYTHLTFWILYYQSERIAY